MDKDKKCAKISEHTPHQNDMQLVNKHVKRCATLYVFRELQIKRAKRNHYVPIIFVNVQNSDSMKCWQGCGAIITLIFIADGNARRNNHYARYSVSFLQTNGSLIV